MILVKLQHAAVGELYLIGIDPRETIIKVSSVDGRKKDDSICDTGNKGKFFPHKANTYPWAIESTIWTAGYERALQDLFRGSGDLFSEWIEMFLKRPRISQFPKPQKICRGQKANRNQPLFFLFQDRNRYGNGEVARASGLQFF
ncbi:MAG: hypothetical protein ACOYXR_05985 [Nitrospirota bacterium]